MNFQRVLQSIRLGARSLIQHKLRSSLTMLGVVFGVGSVVAMLSVGEGASRRALQEIQKLGSLNLIVRSVKPEDEQNNNSTGQRSRTLTYGLLYDDLDRMLSYPAVRRVAPVKLKREEARLGRRMSVARMVGTSPDWFDLVPRELVAGRTINQDDVARHEAVCVLAEELARELLGGEHTLGQLIALGQDAYRIIGIVRTEVGGGGIDLPDRQNDIYVPVTVMRERIGDTVTQRSSGSFQRETVELHQIILEIGETRRAGPRADPGFLAGLRDMVRGGEEPGVVKAMDNVEPTAVAIEAGLERFHAQKDYEVSVPLALLRQARETQRIFSIVLASIAGISLLVGGIGIMNIMLASVTERTKEIGLRRAIGAKRHQIISQFVIETTVLSVIGGLIGVLVGVAIPFAIEQVSDMPTVITPWSVALALGISVFVGIVFGIYPAYRAAMLDPILALRHE